MKTLFNYDLQNYDPTWQHSKRPSARAIILPEVDFSFINTQNPSLSPDTKIALVYSKKCNYYNFPGGGIHSDENPESALSREVTEETALVVDSKKIAEYGKVSRLEKSNLMENTIFDQDSLYYFCDVLKNPEGALQTTTQNLDDYEKDEGFELRILPIKDAIKENQQSVQDNDFYSILVSRDTNVLQLLIGQDVEPNPQFAEVILKEGAKQNPGPWEEHCLAVAESAKKVSQACIQNGYTKLNPQKAYNYGLLHDIGRKMGRTYMAHVYDGYKYFMNFGFKNVAKICLTHSFNTHDITNYIGKVDITEMQYNELKTLLDSTVFDNYDLLIQMLDSTVGSFSLINMEERINDIERRYQNYPDSKRAKNFELKAYFEKLMGRDLYEVLR